MSKKTYEPPKVTLLKTLPASSLQSASPGGRWCSCCKRRTASCHVTSGLRDRQLLLLSPWRWPMLSGPRARPGPHLSARMLLVTGHARRALVHERPAPSSRGGIPLRCDSQAPSGVSLTLPSGWQAAWRHTPRRPPPLVCLCAGGDRPLPEGSGGSPGVAFAVLPRAVPHCGREAWCSHRLGRSHELVTRPKV